SGFYFIGKRKMVEGRVKKARSAKSLVQLDLEGLKIVIFRKDLETFLNAGISPASSYKGKNVRVFGLIKEYKGSAEIILSHPSQIEVIEDVHRSV
ncbi:MAG TPA: hypothetical protein PLU24_02120, partial [Candidatus Omnitrophota bacterium]|nr:hypothetical protein [Candidatus Omnitrophota bacterium]